jgi:hypothetical protein
MKGGDRERGREKGGTEGKGGRERQHLIPSFWSLILFLES